MRNGDRQTADTFAYLFWLSVGEIHAHVRTVLSPGKEWFAGHERDVLAQSRVQQLHGVDSMRHGHPKEEAAMRMRPGDFRGEVVVQGLQHRIATLFVHPANKLY